MNSNPIVEIKDQLETFGESLKGIVSPFQIPTETANRVLELTWEDFQQFSGDFIEKKTWDVIHTNRLKVGESALNGLKFGPATIRVGVEYAVWNGQDWVTLSALSAPQAD